MTEHFFVRFNLLNVTATEVAFMINKMQIAISPDDVAALPTDMRRHIARVEVTDGVQSPVAESKGTEPTEANSAKAA